MVNSEFLEKKEKNNHYKEKVGGGGKCGCDFFAGH